MDEKSNKAIAQEPMKAWQVNLDMLEEGYLLSEIVCHAENINKARSTLLEKVRFDGYKLRYTGEDVTYLNIPVTRAKQYDWTIFEGKKVTLADVEQIKRSRERIAHLDAILSDTNITHCYIRKGSYYAPDCCGYTQYKFHAGVYTKERAVSEAKSVGDVTIEPIDIAAHNAMIEERILDLQTRLIQTTPLT